MPMPPSLEPAPVKGETGVFVALALALEAAAPVPVTTTTAVAVSMSVEVEVLKLPSGFWVVETTTVVNVVRPVLVLYSTPVRKCPDEDEVGAVL